MTHAELERDFDKTNEFLYRFALSILKNPEDAEDVVQETWVKATDFNFDSKKGSIKGVLGTICKRMCIDIIRHRKYIHYYGNVSYDEKLDRSIDAHIEQDVMVKVTSERIKIFLKDKPELLKIFEKIMEGYFLVDILEMRHSTVRGRASMLRKILREQLNKKLENIDRR